MAIKIALHTNFSITPDYIGGTERFLIALAKELRILGFDARIICSSCIAECDVETIPVYGVQTPDFFQKTREIGYFASRTFKEHIFTSDSIEKNLRTLAVYTKYQILNAPFKADVYHFNSFVSIAFNGSLAKNAVVSNHENDKECDKIWGLGFYEQFSAMVRDGKTELGQFPVLRVPSRYYAQKFSKDFHLNVSAIPLGINLMDFPVDFSERQSKHHNSVWNILLPSRMDIYQKGHDVALRACATLSNLNLPFKLICTGAKPGNRVNVMKVEELANDLGIKDYIECSRCDDMRKAYNDADLVISPERFCSYGLSVSESLSLGKTTILSDIPTYQEIGTTCPNAVFFKSEDHEALARAILSVCSEVRETEREMIRFRVQNDLRRCASLYADEYLNLLGNNPISDEKEPI